MITGGWFVMMTSFDVRDKLSDGTNASCITNNTGVTGKMTSSVHLAKQHAFIGIKNPKAAELP